MTTEELNSDNNLSNEKDITLQNQTSQTDENKAVSENNAEEIQNSETKLEENLSIIENSNAQDLPKSEVEILVGDTEVEVPISLEKTDEEEEKDENLVDTSVEIDEIVTSESNFEAKKQEEEVEEEVEEEEKFYTLPDIINELKNLLKVSSVNSWADDSKTFNKFRALGYAQFHAIEKAEKQKWEEEGKNIEEYKFENAQHEAFTEILQSFKTIQEEFHLNQSNQQAKNLEIRTEIIEKLKNLNSNADAGTNLFKEIRIIKEQWSAAGQVPKADFKIINNNYFHHLTQFYEILDLKKEYLEQEYAHNLEKRLHIIARAKELQTEESVQKALNELQYLHKLWKEEAVPVAEEFREKTWEEFKDISDKIHDRRAELSVQMEAEHAENLFKKNAIINEIKKLGTPEKEPNHNYWQNCIKKIELLREEFLKTGSVSRKLSNQNWQEFKDALKNFNNAKNNYYKDQKNSQQKNLDEKLKLIQIAKDNNTSEDWETMVTMFKNLQQDWKKIGHVPRSMADKIWKEFREVCNVFFDNYREKSNETGDNWQENFAAKKELLNQLKAISNQDGSVEKIEEIKTAWNAVGKIPKDKLSLHTDFNKTLREKLKLNNIQEFELKEEGLSEHQITDKARRIKSQISDLEAEIAKLENNLGFFSNSTRENPLLAETYKNIDDKKEILDNLKQSLHQIIVGE